MKIYTVYTHLGSAVNFAGNPPWEILQPQSSQSNFRAFRHSSCNPKRMWYHHVQTMYPEDTEYLGIKVTRFYTLPVWLSKSND